jgi:ribA/ribD-fused uncharacterized protein
VILQLHPPQIKAFKGTYAFLSNFSPARVKLGDLWYPTVEHAYQAAKTRDIGFRRDLACDEMTAAAAKKAGKSVTLRANWELVKLKVMESLVRQKFLDRELMQKLLYTEQSELIEGNYWHDNFWGVCECPKCIHYIVGKNHLGNLLMQIRGELQGFRIIYEQKLIAG